MSLEDKRRINEAADAVTMLFAGREPSERVLKKAPLLEYWTVRLDRPYNRRMLSLVGYKRSAVGDVQVSPGELLWLDRKERFAITYVGIWRLGEREDEIPLVQPPIGDDR